MQACMHACICVPVVHSLMFVMASLDMITAIFGQLVSVAHCKDCILPALKKTPRRHRVEEAVLKNLPALKQRTD